MSLVQLSNSEIVIDHDAVLQALKLNPRDPNTQALLLVCDRYGLDPLLKHMVLIQGNPYVTRDGYLAIAHRSRVFDGMEVLDQGADETHYWAKVAVWRKDMSHPFTYVGRFPASKQMAKDFGPEMAIKVAEVMGLRRAFNVTGVSAADERWDERVEHEDSPGIASTAHRETGGTPGEAVPPAASPGKTLKELHARVKALPPASQQQYTKDRKGFGLPSVERATFWTPEQLELAWRLLEEIELSAGPIIQPDDGPGTEPF